MGYCPNSFHEDADHRRLEGRLPQMTPSAAICAGIRGHLRPPNEDTTEYGGGVLKFHTRSEPQNSLPAPRLRQAGTETQSEQLFSVFLWCHVKLTHTDTARVPPAS